MNYHQQLSMRMKAHAIRFHLSQVALNIDSLMKILGIEVSELDNLEAAGILAKLVVNLKLTASIIDEIAESLEEST